MPAVRGLLETALYVEDVDRSRRFYQDLFGFDPLVAEPVFSALHAGPQQVLLLFRKGSMTQAAVSSRGTIPPHDGSGRLHLAFAIGTDELAAWEMRLGEKGIAIEGRMTWSRGGQSLYFRDPDGHLVELATPGIWSIY